MWVPGERCRRHSYWLFPVVLGPMIEADMNQPVAVVGPHVADSRGKDQDDDQDSTGWRRGKIPSADAIIAGMQALKYDVTQV